MLIRSAGQCALGDIDLFLSLPCGFMEKDEGPDRLIKLLLWPERPLLDTCPLIRSLSAGSFRSSHLPQPFRDNDVSFKRTPLSNCMQEFNRVLAHIAPRVLLV